VRDEPQEALGAVRCPDCGLEADAVAEVVVDADRVRRHGGCCAGFVRHEVSWHTPDEEHAGSTRFETWVQDPVMLPAGDRVSLVFAPGEATGPTRRPPMPYLAIDHDRAVMWRLVVP
jgi:hypothetical protein